MISARLVETDEKELVLRIAVLKNLQGGFLGLARLCCHTAAEIEDDADGNGDVFRKRNTGSPLFDVVFEDAEVIGLKTCNQAIMRVSDGNVDKRQVHVRYERIGPA